MVTSARARPLWRFEPDLERDGDSRQHATQHNDREHGRWPFGADEGGLAIEYRVNRLGAVTNVTRGRCDRHRLSRTQRVTLS